MHGSAGQDQFKPTINLVALLELDAKTDNAAS